MWLIIDLSSTVMIIHFINAKFLMYLLSYAIIMAIIGRILRGHKMLALLAGALMMQTVERTISYLTNFVSKHFI